MMQSLNITQSSGYTGSGIIKTIIMPNEELNKLGLESEELRNFLVSQQNIYEEALSGYHKDRVIREQEFKLKEIDFKERIDELNDRLKMREEANYQLSKDYFAYKHAVSKNKQKL